MKRKTTLMLIVAALFLSLCRPHPGSADIYQHTDENGVIHFSNVGIGAGKKYKKTKSAAAPRPNDPSQAPLSSSSNPNAYADIINTASYRHGIDPALVHAVVKVESNFNTYALSKKGAMGLMQLMPLTALELNVRNSFNPGENIDGGVKYLRYLIDRYEGNLSLALAAYNSGETAVKKWGTIPPFRETQNYVQSILKLYSGRGKGFTPRYTIYMSYGEDGALLITDDPGKRQGKNFKHKTPNIL